MKECSCEEPQFILKAEQADISQDKHEFDLMLDIKMGVAFKHKTENPDEIAIRQKIVESIQKDVELLAIQLKNKYKQN